jgi:hypothetical protein
MAPTIDESMYMNEGVGGKNSNDYSPKPLKLNLKTGANFLQNKKNSINKTTNLANCNDTSYLLGSNIRTTNFFQNDSINMGNLNLTNEYSSLSPTSYNQNNLNNSSLVMKNSNDLQ